MLRRWHRDAMAVDRAARAWIEKIERDFRISLTGMKKIARDFHLEMERGLAGRKSSLRMLPAYCDRPTGREKGSFLALDLGGTNFRILELELKGAGAISAARVMKFSLDKKHISGSGKELFDFIARSIKIFLRKGSSGSKARMDLGFTFSFPLEQTAAASGRLVKWTKGFSAKGVEGEDVVGLLREALARNGLEGITVSVLANDTVGTLAAHSYLDPACDIGIIWGTGTNACYVEDIANIRKWRGPQTPTGKMIVNIEWGNFDRVHTTIYDKRLDKGSSNPGHQIMEKMVSGMYLGELTRSVLRDSIARKMIFNENTSTILDKRRQFKTEYMSEIEGDSSPNLFVINRLLKKLGIEISTLNDRIIVKRICRSVSSRASRISAAALSAVLKNMDPRLSKRHAVAIDGTLYEKHPHFSKEINSALRQLLGPKAALVKTVLTKDGSGKGAAVLAAVGITA